MNTRRLLPPLLSLAAGFLLGGAVCRDRSRPDDVRPGTPVTVVRPTGRVVTARHGVHPQPETETVRLVVYRAMGDTTADHPPGPVWRLTVGGRTLFLRPE